jgi:hypothetical protein
MQPATAAPRVPTLDRIAGAFAARWPRIMQRLGDLETRVVREHTAQVRIERPVYICGLARAGSTILLEMLARAPGFTSHRYSDYAFLWTPFWWNSLRSRLPLATPLPAERAHCDRIVVTPGSPEALEELLWMHFFPGRHNPELDQVLDADNENAAFDAFYAAHIRKLLAVRCARRYVAKGNYNLTRLGYLQRLFPDARFVIAVREPLAHVASLVKQDRLFSDWARASPAISRHLVRSGHFEFGACKRAVNSGDYEQAAGIQSCFDAGRAIEGYARQWAASYGWLGSRLAADAELARACLLVRYEHLCSAPEQTLRALYAHAGVVDSDIASLVSEQAPLLAAPDYYIPEFAPAEREMISAITEQAWCGLPKEVKNCKDGDHES